MSDTPIEILYIDDYLLDRELVRDSLEKEHGGFKVTEAETRQEFEAKLFDNDYDIVLSDFNILGFEGLQVLDIVQKKKPGTPVIIVTGTGSEEVAVQAMKRGAADYVIKTPHQIRRLPSTIYAVLEEQRLRVAHEKVQEQLRFQAAVLQNVRDCVIVTDLEGHIRYWNQGAQSIFDYSTEEAIGQPLSLLYSEQDMPNYTSDLQAVLEIGEFSGEWRGEHKDGSTVWLDIRTTTMFDSKGHPVGFIGVSKDITDRKQAEEEIQRQNRELTLLNRIIAVTTASLEPEIVLDITCKELVDTFAATQAHAILLDESEREARVVADYRGVRESKVLNQVIPVEDGCLFESLRVRKSPLTVVDIRRDTYSAPFYRLLRERGTVSILILPLVIKEKVVGSINLESDKLHEFVDEEIDLAWKVADQVAASLARARLALSRRRLSAAIEQAAESVIITDTDWRVLYANPAFERITGFDRAEVIGRPFHDFYADGSSELFEEIRDRLTRSEVWQGHLLNQKKNGTNYTVDATISPVRDENGVIINYVALKRDITAELQLEEQLRQSQKMEAIGRLAGGVAHDFNNLLTIITGYSDVLLSRFAEEDHPLREDVAQIKKAGARAASLTRQLLAFSRRQTLQPKKLNVNTVVSDVNKMLGRLIGEDVDLVINLDPNLGLTEVDPGQLEQVILNLAVNARDAMLQGGKLTVETANVTLDAGYMSRHQEVAPGSYVMLSISDTGAGIDSETLPHIFEPFFTTKTEGKGTGLGLATVHGIVKQSNGHIWVYSEPGYGTTFKIYLPRIDASSESLQQNQPSDQLSQGLETILVVEDEVMVRQLVSTVLTNCGYTVLEAVNGHEALRIYEKHAEEIHLLLTDVIMPEMSGGKLVKELTSLHPNIKVLFMSGYTDNVIADQGILELNAGFLQKPFSLHELTQKVREVLDTPRGELNK